MQMPPGTKEYERETRKAKDHLIRLDKGMKMFDKAVQDEDFVTAGRVMRHWRNMANDTFHELELAALLHQRNLTGNTIGISSKGRAIDLDHFIEKDDDKNEVDPWTLLSLEKLVTVFGEDVKQLIDVK